ncbi:MAG: hypothetical protein ACI9AT_001139 [Ulvibacter sp.]|jgi:hypothetical protein
MNPKSLFEIGVTKSKLSFKFNIKSKCVFVLELSRIICRTCYHKEVILLKKTSCGLSTLALEFQGFSQGL